MVRILWLLFFIVSCGQNDHSQRLTLDSYAVIGKDDRIRIKKFNEIEDLPVGQVITHFRKSRDPMSCTGTLIEKDLVVTAAHCVHADKKGPPRKIRFHLKSLGRAKKEATYKGDHVFISTTLINNPLSRDEIKINQIGGDLAFIRLRQEVESVKPLALEANLDSSHNSVELYSYPADKRSGTLWYSGECGVNQLKDFNKVLVFLCDTFFGSSGGALISKDNGEFKVFGIVSASSNKRNYAAKISKEVIEEVKSFKSKAFTDNFIAYPTRY